MIRLLITLCLVLYLAACTSKPSQPSKKPTSNEPTTSQSKKDEEYKRKIAALDKKIKELEQKKAEPVEVEPPKVVSAPQEVSAPKEINL